RARPQRPSLPMPEVLTTGRPAEGPTVPMTCDFACGEPERTPSRSRSCTLDAARRTHVCQARIVPLTCGNDDPRRPVPCSTGHPGRGTPHMTFTVRETVVYPNHGAAVIEDIEMRTIKGEDRQYLVLRIVAQQDLVVRVPACNLDLVGVRDVVDK